MGTVMLNLKEEVSPEFYFRLADGRVLKSVPELLLALRNMEDWVFNHHVTAEKNDFLKWIEDVSRMKVLSSINNSFFKEN